MQGASIANLVCVVLATTIGPIHRSRHTHYHCQNVSHLCSKLSTPPHRRHVPGLGGRWLGATVVCEYASGDSLQQRQQWSQSWSWMSSDILGRSAHPFDCQSQCVPRLPVLKIATQKIIVDHPEGSNSPLGATLDRHLGTIAPTSKAATCVLKDIALVLFWGQSWRLPFRVMSFLRGGARGSYRQFLFVLFWGKSWRLPFRVM